MLNFEKLFEQLKSYNSFLITTHVNPDGDAIGAEIAIADILEQLNKQYYIINTSETPYNLEFLDINNKIKCFDDEKHSNIFNKIDSIILLDLNHLSRTSRMSEYIRKFDGNKICIDHHTNPEGLTNDEFINASKSSTGEIIYDFIENIEKLNFNNNNALAIYTAILTDTGSFRFSRTNSQLHIKVAKLLEYAVKPENVFDEIYGQNKFSRNKLLGEALHSIELTESGKVSYMTITQESLLNSGGTETDVDGFVNYTLTTKGVKIGMLFFELKDGLKISFRSKDKIPVSKLAEQFGGGGHLNASGTRLYNVKLNDILPEVIKSAEQILLNEEN